MMQHPSTLYHGTSEDGASRLVESGIDMRRTQSRDHGFFGEGFYATTWVDSAKNHATQHAAPAIVELSLSSNARVLDAGETFEASTIVPQSPPSWHNEFINWRTDKLDATAVWERISSKSRTDIIERGEAEMTPGDPQFDRERWYQEVTEFADEQGYDVVYWTDAEIVIKNPSVIGAISRTGVCR